MELKKKKKKRTDKKNLPVDILAFSWTRHNEGDIIDLIKIGLWGPNTLAPHKDTL